MTAGTGLGQWIGDYDRSRYFSPRHRSWIAWHPDSAIFGRRRDLSVLRLRDWDIPRHDRAFHATARPIVHVGVHADELAFW